MLRVLLSMVMLMIAPLISSTYSLVDSSHDVRTIEETEDISYEESFDETINSDRGYYTPVFFRFRVEDNTTPYFGYSLIHLRADLTNFTSAFTADAKDIPLSDDMLNALDKILGQIEEHNHSVILRFAYDLYFEGTMTKEPQLEMILLHQEQLGKVISKHKNAIACVETGMLGKWGELHGTEMCNRVNTKAIVEQWLKVLDESICVSVRTPWHYSLVRGIELTDIMEDITVPGEKEYRIGMYNDGYLGSVDDLGTYTDRKKEIRWLFNQAKHALFGGEMMDPAFRKEDQSSAAYVETEAFLTHTSYLNSQWAYTAYMRLANEIYDGRDAHYQGQTGLTFVRNHLGYRFVLRSAKMTKEVTRSDNLMVKLTVDNVGFANLIKPKKVFLVLEGEQEQFTIPVTDHILNNGEYVINCDPTKWDSDTRVYIRMNFKIPTEVPIGKYKLYLKVAYDPENVNEGYGDYPVQFANNQVDFWKEELGANYIGEIRIIDKR